jgi:FtsP/CotA-like multicopper oxidase with cupredoxin domain
MKMNRRDFLKIAGATSGAFAAMKYMPALRRAFAAPIPGGTLDPTSVPKYLLPLVKPPAMPAFKSNKKKDFFKIAVKQFDQQILPPGFDPTTVWSYGPADLAPTLANSYFYPAFTVEALANRTTQVQWVNGLVDGVGNHLPHLLPVDQTLHWANPPGGLAMRDRRGLDPAPYMGPVPIVTHVHGAHTTEDSDGYAEAWYLPDAASTPAGYATTGTFYDYFKAKYGHDWAPGTATFKYPNDQPATTLWYHDHTLGMTRLNVYAGPAGFWLIRGGMYDQDLGYVAPGLGDDPFGEYTEIPIAIQDRSFNDDGSLFYPDNRAFFEGLDVSQLQIPFTPDAGVGGMSDISPIWNPEFFGNMMVVNGRTWPYLDVEQRRYRFRLLNGCNSRFLILKTSNDMPFYQIGGDQGFLPAPVPLNELLMAPAERADVIMDFSSLPVGTEITLMNIGPDEPFGGGMPGVDFDPADPATTGQVMQFRVKAATSADTSIVPVTLPAASVPLPVAATRDVSLNEEESKTVFVHEVDGNIVFDPTSDEPFGPQSALLGTLNEPLEWMAPITEKPLLNTTEEWTIHNFTADAHPIHVHQIKFEVVERADADGSNPRLPEVWETGPKDTVISYPGEITKIRMHFDLPGYYVWHCHIVEHEDNEMMRPFYVKTNPGDEPSGPQP